jgi:hypothetical protein
VNFLAAGKQHVAYPFLPDFAASMLATGALIAVPGPPASLSLFRENANCRLHKFRGGRSGKWTHCLTSASTLTVPTLPLEIESVLVLGYGQLNSARSLVESKNARRTPIVLTAPMLPGSVLILIFRDFT